jgi:peroxiredoxin family protein
MEAKKVTILLERGDLDAALSAFVIANGHAALGSDVTMWFMIWGYNCLKKRRPWWSPLRRPDPAREGTYRALESDNWMQWAVGLVNRGGLGHLPLSRLDLLGVGPALFDRMLRRKGILTLDGLIAGAVDLGVRFKMCQICFDALGNSVDDLIVPDVKVAGVAEYARDTLDAHVNLFV